MCNRLIYINKVPDQFHNDENYIKNMIDYFCNKMKIKSQICIKFIDNADLDKYTDKNEYEETDCLLKSYSVEKHELIITNSVLNSISFDGGDHFCLSIYHELKHIEDFINMMNTKLFDFNFCKVRQKNFEQQYISTGYLFWTEIYAYYETIYVANINKIKYEKITFSRLVKNYRKTIDLDKQFYYKQDLTYDEAVKYINSVKSFIYLCAKFMASFYVKHSKVPISKIEKDKDYKRVYSILCGLEPKVKRLLNNSYSKKSYDNLFKLGKQICENIQWKIFNVGLVKSKGSVTTFY